MHIKKLELENIRCFRNIEFDLMSAKGPKSWAVLTGDNGVGKTTFLRALAIGLSDKDGASGLLRDTYGDWILKGQKQARIKVHLHDPRDPKGKYSIETTFHKSAAGREAVNSHETTPGGRKFPWQELFVCGYGANRRTEGSNDYSEYSPDDAVYTLFNYDYPLQSPEIVLRRLAMHREVIYRKALGWLDHAFMLEPGSTKLLEGGITIEGPWGKGILSGALPDGYEATMTWVLDLIGWAVLRGQLKRSSKLSGIVLIDELEQHLHPRWQREIVSRLHGIFPDLQFIATTHSPICAGGTADIPDGAATLGVLTRTGSKEVSLDTDLPSLAGLRADQILATRAFGHITAANTRTEALLHLMSVLEGRGKRRTREEDNTYRRVRKEIKGIVLATGQTAFERDLLAEISRETRQKIEALEKKLFRGEKE